MLALDVNLLTSRLQKQCLDDTNKLAPVSNEGLKLSESAQARLAAADPGKEVWTMSLTPTSSSGVQYCKGGSKERNPGDDGNSPYRTPPTGAVDTTSCDNCQGSYGHGETRPKKRTCRSITVPLEHESETNIPPAKSSWQPKGSDLWKPATMNPIRNSSRPGMDGKFDVRTVTWSPIDCRHYEFSSLAPSVQRHRETGHITPDDLLTPPESPVPRPNSVFSNCSTPVSRPHSVYSDGAISPYMSEPYYNYIDHSHNRIQHIQEFRNRSLSVEERISNISANPQVSSFYASSANTAQGAMCGITPTNNAIPTSPHHRHRVPRCRSQPSFYDRKSGRRRRRDSRPTLNFHKMTETAYGYLRKSDGFLAPERHGSRFHSDLENAMSLTTIASSPHDQDHLQHFEHQPGSNVAKTVDRFYSNGSPIHEFESTNRDSVGVSDVIATKTGPVKLLGDLDDEDMEVFQFTEELDLEQIEND
ncbi:FA53A-like protein [Mya arenaria]|uniref:FA53A-like protein n=1 Tax=Mya arenaria TaxID=6604 RepID=A0ABY7FQX6_MYAAR|nr:protein FAM53A-like [Mya arenaria]XP_052772391.1 protein FAM53A-like [Mya arenaria]XP_052772392.1 protein FAM53A-like [Mya arenaria]XP_052772393.1 protein FAM53A-like [Mya arenaria]WAR21611.1 FA53A-like protein [Mya arenaria]